MPFALHETLKSIFITICIISVLLCLSACKKEEPETNGTTFLQSTAATDSAQDYTLVQEETTAESDNDVDAYITLSDNSTTVSGNGATFENNILTVYEGGTYKITGKLTEGKIYVNSSDETKKVKLLLSGVSVNCSTDAPLYIENSPDETVLILDEGTSNSFSDTARSIPSDATEYATAAVYSKDDLQIEGNGSLTVTGNFEKGIFSKNDIDIHSGTVTVNSVDDGIRGKESVEISGGTINIVCGGDGIRTNEENNPEKGNIDISGGTVNVESQLDSIQSTAAVNISGGILSLKSGGGVTGAYSGGNDMFGGFGGGRQYGDSYYSESDSDTKSTKGIKAETTVTVSGGTITADCLDDSIHAPVVSVGGGELTLKSDDDGIHADNQLTVTDGQIFVTQSYEGIEGRTIDISGGKLVIISNDDGFNAASSDSSETAVAEQITDFNLLNFGGNFGGFAGGMMGYDSSCNINVSGGTVIINAQGDGVDSNGSVTMTDGKMIVYGPTNGGNGALDYGGSFNVSGGTLLAVGSSGMAQSVTGNGVEVFDFYADGQADTVYAVADSNNNCIIAFTSVKSFESVVFASEGISQNESYSFYQGGRVTGYSDASYGICFDGVYSGGTLIASLS